MWLSLGATLIFWFIDAYYLMLEQSYRKLYDKVAETDIEKIDYKMGVKDYICFSAWIKAFKRPVLLMFYGVILVVTICVIIGSNFDISLIIKLKE